MDYIFKLDPSPTKIHTDIEYITSDDGDQVIESSNNIISDWSVIPMNILVGLLDFILSSGEILIDGKSINFHLLFPLLSGLITIEGDELDFYRSLYFQLLPGTIRINGTSIAIDVTNSGKIDFVLNSGVIRIGGTPINMVINRVIIITHPTKFKITKGNITISGSPLNFIINFPLNSGTIRLSGNDLGIDIYRNLTFQLDSGEIKISGKPIAFITEPKTFLLLPGNIKVNGQELEFNYRIFSLDAGTIIIGKSTILFSISGTSEAKESERFELSSLITSIANLNSEIQNPMSINSNISSEFVIDGNIHW